MSKEKKIVKNLCDPDLQIVNLGVLAHVDAGKTSLTEQLLFCTGGIEKLGSVDSGDTSTDTGYLERERGITIRAAVASICLDEMQINLVDTPGHPDFVAEVERALSILDCAVLVISAVEGIQSQTRLLMKHLKNIRLPTFIFVNKVDRMGAKCERLLADITRKLNVDIFCKSKVNDPGTENARIVKTELSGDQEYQQALEILSENHEEYLEAYIGESYVSRDELELCLNADLRDCKLHFVYFGSAIKGLGVDLLIEGIRSVMSRTERNQVNCLDAKGKVFSIKRNSKGEKKAYLRMFTGQISVRQKVAFTQLEPNGEERLVEGVISELEVLSCSNIDSGINTHDSFVAGSIGTLTAGNIGIIGGISDIRVGAEIGIVSDPSWGACFPEPNLESIISSEYVGDSIALYKALTELSEEDPLIHIRINEAGDSVVRLYGEVQKEVIADRLNREYGIRVCFSDAEPLYKERPVGVGHALVEINPRGPNDFWATVGFRVEPNGLKNGNTYRREVPLGQMPSGFYDIVEHTALKTLEQGLYGWGITDCSVALTKVGYAKPVTVAADFRNLVPVVLLRALKEAKTKLFEPQYSFELIAPNDSQPGIVRYLSSNGVEIYSTERSSEESCTLRGAIACRLTKKIMAAIPGLTHGEGALLTSPGRDRPLRGGIRRRTRTDGNPLDYEEYTRFLSIGRKVR